MHTTQSWWNETKSDTAKLLNWLADQYHGEVTASERIEKFAREYAPASSRWQRVLATIARQERTHAAWVAELLSARGLTPTKLAKNERYWGETLPAIDSFESGAAVAAHAEAMRLERIMVIAADELAPADIRAVFEKILPDERFHARAFARMAGDAAMQAALANHRAGLAALGLIPESF